MWWIVQCPELRCSKHMLVRARTKRKKCVYCNRSFKVDDNFINMYHEQVDAREMVKKFNSRLRD